MNKKFEAALKYSLSCCKEAMTQSNFTIHDILKYVNHEWKMPVSLSMLLYVDEDMLQQFCNEGYYDGYEDELAELRRFQEALIVFMKGGEFRLTEKEITQCIFNMEETAGIYGCRLANLQNQKRFTRAIKKMFGVWDGHVNPETYHYIYRQLNYAIKDEIYCREVINQKLPLNLKMPI